jgi:EpsI family protein
MITRYAVLMALFAGAFAGRAILDSPRPMTTAESLNRFPQVVGAWEGENVPLAPDVIKVAAVDDYLNRNYRSSHGVLGLYIGYYQSQRQGESLHSPLFCLPGTGWQPTDNRTIDLRTSGGRQGAVKQLVVERGLDRLVVLYWYQTVARVTGSEYWRKLFLMHDAFFSGRTDVALVRIITAVESRDADSESKSVDRARPFAELVLPEVQQRLFRE